MDYLKLAIRFSNLGINLAHDPTSLQFGQFTVLTNAATLVEGQLTSRYGFKQVTSAPTSLAHAIIGVRRLNDSILGLSTYIARVDDSLDCTTNGSGTITNATTADNWLSNHSGYLATGFTDGVFGSFLVNRTSYSNQVWCYVGDTSRMVKAGITLGGGMDIKNVGIGRPTGPPTTVASTATGQLTLLGTYIYRYTLFDSATGVESLFNSMEDPGTTLSSSENTITVTIPTESVDAATTDVRIYRKGGTLSTWNRLDTVAYTGTSINYTDDSSDAAIASSELLDEVSDVPFTTTDAMNVDNAGTPLPFLWGPVNGYVMACGDPLNTGYVYWTNKFNPDSQDPANNVEVTSPQDPLMNGFVYDGKSFVFSREGLYQMYLGLDQNSTWTPFKTSCGHGLYAPHAFCVGPEIYFLAKDGIYATGGGQERSLTDDTLRPIFFGQSVSGCPAIDFSATELPRMAYHNNHIWFEFRSVEMAGTIYYLVYSLIYKRWTVLRPRVSQIAMYDDEDVISTSSSVLPSRLITGGGDGRLYNYTGTADDNGDGTTIPFQIRTGLITLDTPLIHKEWGPIVFDLDPQDTTVTVKVYINKGQTLAATTTFSDTGRARRVLNLNDLFAEDIQIEISWASSAVMPILYGYELLYKKDAISLTRWAVIDTDHGIEGWQILRSAYVTLRSDGDVSFNVTVDNAITYSYNIASTSGNKVKTFIPLNPIKGKLFTYTIVTNGASYFRLYNDDCEVHVKPWVTSLGYARINPFQGGDGSDMGTSGNGVSQGLSTGIQGGGDGSASGAGSNPFTNGTFDFLGAGGAPIAPPGTQTPTNNNSNLGVGGSATASSHKGSSIQPL